MLTHCPKAGRLLCVGSVITSAALQANARTITVTNACSYTIWYAFNNLTSEGISIYVGHRPAVQAILVASKVIYADTPARYSLIPLQTQGFLTRPQGR